MIVSVPSDDMVEAWFAQHAGVLSDVSARDLDAVAEWFPIISVAANDS